MPVERDDRLSLGGKKNSKAGSIFQDSVRRGGSSLYGFQSPRDREHGTVMQSPSALKQNHKD